MHESPLLERSHFLGFCWLLAFCCLSLFVWFAFLFLWVVCVFGFLAGIAYWTAYRSITSTFVAIDNWQPCTISIHLLLRWTCVTTWRKPWRRWTEKIPTELKSILFVWPFCICHCHRHVSESHPWACQIVCYLYFTCQLVGGRERRFILGKLPNFCTHLNLRFSHPNILGRHQHMLESEDVTILHAKHLEKQWKAMDQKMDLTCQRFKISPCLPAVTKWPGVLSSTVVTFHVLTAVFPESVWAQGSSNSGGLSLIFSSSHLLTSYLLIFTSSHLHTFSSSHLLIFTSSHLPIFTSSHLHIFSSSHRLMFTAAHLHIFSSSHLLIFTSSHLHIFSSSHLLIFTSAHLHIFTSAHLHICSSSHLHICSSSHLLILTSLHLTSSHLHIFSSCPLGLLPSCPLLHIFSSSHLHIFITSSSHLHHIFITSSHPHIFTSSPLALLPSCPLAPLALLPLLPSPSFLFLF